MIVCQKMTEENQELGNSDILFEYKPDFIYQQTQDENPDDGVKDQPNEDNAENKDEEIEQKIENQEDGHEQEIGEEY